MSINGERERGSGEEDGRLYLCWVNLAVGAHMAMCCKRSALGPQHMCVYMGLCVCVCVCVCLKVCVRCHGNKTAGCPPSFPGHCVSVVKTCAGHSHSHSEERKSNPRATEMETLR